MTTTRWWRWLPAAAMAAELAGALVPWAASGRVERNSYRLVLSARRLDVLDSAPERLLTAVWWLLPLAVVAAVVAVVTGRQGVAAVLAVSTGLAGLAMVAIVRDVPLAERAGLDLTWWAAILTMITGPAAAWADQRHDRIERHR